MKPLNGLLLGALALASVAVAIATPASTRQVIPPPTTQPAPTVAPLSVKPAATQQDPNGPCESFKTTETCPKDRCVWKINPAAGLNSSPSIGKQPKPLPGWICVAKN